MSFASRHLRKRALHTSRVLRNAVSTLIESPETSAKLPALSKWTANSIRSGLIARKRGMTAMWDDQGVRHGVTVLQIENCQVTSNIKTIRKGHTEYHAVQVAASDKSAKATTSAMKGIYEKAGVPYKRIMKEFAVTPDAHIPIGTTLSAAHFVPGQYVDVVGTSIGKGFQGVMKRWGFGGQSSSHGTSKAHRSAGATGAHQDPGRVWPGKKMAGHMGNKRITTQNLLVMRIDLTHNLIYLKGCVPGHTSTQLLVRDAKKKMEQNAQHMSAKARFEVVLPKGVDDLPFPAGTLEMAQAMPAIIESPSRRTNPFIPRE